MSIKFSHYIYNLTAAAMVIFPASSCSDGMAPDLPKGDEDAISVSIALAGIGPGDTRAGDGGISQATRAVGEDSEDTDGAFGNAEENYIDVNDLYIMTFSIPTGKSVLDADSQLLEVIWNGNKPASDETSVKYINGYAYLHAKLSKDIAEYASGDFALVAIANFSQFKKKTGSFSLAQGMKFSELKGAMQYVFVPENAGKSWSWYPSETDDKGKVTMRGIPLFGVKKVNLDGYNSQVNNSGNPYKLGGGQPLWLLRAFAKVEIELSDALIAENDKFGDISIADATINNKYKYEFDVIPKLDRMSGFSETGGTGQVINRPSFPMLSTSISSDIMFSVIKDGRCAVIYLPEYNFSSSNSNKIWITLNLNIGESKEDFEIEFKNYGSSSGTSTPLEWQYLLRNHSYKFLISLDYKVISVNTTDWKDAFDNDFNFDENTP